MIRIFGYSRAVARTNSHFGGVEAGTEFAISDLRSFQIKNNNWVFPGAKETSCTYSIVRTQHSDHVASLKWLASLAFRMKVIKMPHLLLQNLSLKMEEKKSAAFSKSLIY